MDKMQCCIKGSGSGIVLALSNSQILFFSALEWKKGFMNYSIIRYVLDRTVKLTRNYLLDYGTTITGIFFHYNSGLIKKSSLAILLNRRAKQ